MGAPPVDTIFLAWLIAGWGFFLLIEGGKFFQKVALR